MTITVNGEQTEIGEGLSVSDLLAHRKVRMPDMVSVELNGAIVDRKRFSETFIKQADKIEFLYFMGGGTTQARAMGVWWSVSGDRDQLCVPGAGGDR